MIETRTMIRSLLALLLLGGVGTGLAISDVAWNTENFDAYDESEGFIDLELEDGTLVVTLEAEEGAIPASIEGDTLPLDEDLDEDRLLDENALALYGGLPVEVRPTAISLELDGEPEAIDEAILSRLSALGLQTEELERGGRVHAWRVSSGEDAWRLSLSHVGGGTTLHLQSIR